MSQVYPPRSVFRPLIWQGPRTPHQLRRGRNTFKATFTDTVDLLDREVRLLGASEYVIQADFTEADIRLDGMPRANAKQPSFPGIRVSFDSQHGPLTYQTDSCVFWQHNIRSIGLGLEALRAVKRFGIAEHGEQYRGYKAIEGVPFEIRMGYDEALIFMAEHSGYSKDDIMKPGYLRSAYMKAARKLHPDQQSGSDVGMSQLNAAMEILKENL